MTATDLTRQEPQGGSLATQDLRNVLRRSLYPGAAEESVDMVLEYCRAARLDPLQKPVHIVPMTVATGEKDRNGYDKKARRDVIMPGIGLYRTQAARTGQYAGVTAPEFGPVMVMSYEETVWEDGPNDRRVKRSRPAELEYPEWCSMTVYRMVQGVRVGFEAREYFTENYATKSTDTDEPNAMWAKRPYGQLAKCTEAQALRKGFPEATGSAPTYEEMEGRHTMEPEERAPRPGKPEVQTPREKEPEARREPRREESGPGLEPQVQDVTAKPARKETVDADGVIHGRQPVQDEGPGNTATEGEKAFILQRLNRKGLTLAQACELANVDARENLENVSRDEFTALKDALR